MKSKLSACLVVLLMIVSVSAGTALLSSTDSSDVNMSETGVSGNFLSNDETSESDFILSVGSDDSFTDSVCIREITSVDGNNKLCINNTPINTETTTISVSDVEDLNTLSGIVNGTYDPSGSSPIKCDFAGYTVILTEDVKLQALKNGESSNFKPIGDEINKFNGTFDGQGHKISNLIVNTSSNEQSLFAGLFGHAGEKSIIKNLGMIDSNIFSDPADGRAFAGGITGCNDGTIVNCYNTGKITATSKVSNANAGGITGKNEGTITNCYNTGEITATFTVSSDGFYADSGGIAGYNVGGTIVNCYNTGNVSANATNTSEGSKVCSAGITGYNMEGTISNCYNTGKISAASESSDTSAGGIVGHNENAISNCYNTGEITANLTIIGSNEAHAESGGVAGFNSGIISNCYNIGEILVTSKTSGACSGGIVGYNRGTIFECYNGGSISSTSEASGVCSGGIAGINKNGGTIADCCNAGNVTATISTDSKDPEAHSGGIAGNNNNGTISDCYNTGEVTATSEIANISSGGIVGYNEGTVTNCYNIEKISADLKIGANDVHGDSGGVAGFNSGMISNCYNTGEISIASKSSGICSGGIAGYNIGTISDCNNTGSVTAIMDTASKDPEARLGGMAGINKNGGTISNSYSVGKISATPESSNVYLGGIAGSNEETMLNVFYLDTSASKGAGFGTDAAVKLTSDQIKGLNILGASEYNLNTGDSKLWSPDIFNINNGYPILADVSIAQVYLTFENETSPAQNHLGPVCFGKNSSQTLKVNAPETDKNTTYQWYMMNESGVLVKINGENSDSLKVSDEGAYMGKIVCDGFTYTSHTRNIEDGAKVLFDSNGGNDVASQIVDIDTNVMMPADPVKEGYTFAGWHSDKELTTAYDFNTPVSDNMTLYAKWDKNESGSNSSSLLIGGIAAVIIILIIVALAYYFMKKKKQ